MNDLSGKKHHYQANGYAANKHNTISHKPVAGTKSMGFTHVKRGLNHATTKSLPPGMTTHHHAQWKTISKNQALNAGLATSRKVHAKHSNGHVAGTIRRHLPERREHNISFFDIEMDKSDKYIHRPGEEVKGCIHMDVVGNVEIRFLELMVVGQGSITFRKGRHGLPRTQKEVYLSKRTYVIGTGDSRWTSVLTPGHYVSNFKVKLPKDIPSSISYEDSATGVTFDISYFLKARLCDDIGSASTRSIVSYNNAVKVLLSRKQNFNVQRGFDVHLIPNALVPVVHDEEVVLSCGNNSIAQFSLGLDRAVFLAGDDIRLQLTSALPSSQKIKDIVCILRQHIVLKEARERESFVLSEMTRRNPQDVETQRGPITESSFDITIPTQTHLLSSFLYGCRSLQVTYTLDVVIKLTPAGGKLSFTIPIAMGPCAEPIYAEKTASRKFVPVFNRPVRFPCFSPSQQRDPQLQPSQRTQSSQSINVVTKYSNGVVSRCFLCCFGGSTID